jgi:phosphate transport system substrate-binding protein
MSSNSIDKYHEVCIMKCFYRNVAFISLAAIIASCGCSAHRSAETTISLSGAFALYPMALKWGEEYKKVNPSVKFDITGGGAGKGMTDALAGMVDIGMVSREITKDEVAKGAWFMSSVIDAVVPVFNAGNPLYAEIMTRGIRKKECAKIWDKSPAKKWKSAIPSLGADSALNVYTRSDACGAAQTWGAFFGKKQEEMGGIGVFGDPGLAEAVRKDVNGIGYNNINFVYDKDSKKPAKGLAILPIDINGNGKIDDDEKVYETRDMITDAIAKGTYPSPPARKLYLVVKNGPAKPELKKFLKWVLTDGQKYVQESGYILLLPEEVRANLLKIGD